MDELTTRNYITSLLKEQNLIETYIKDANCGDINFQYKLARLFHYNTFYYNMYEAVKYYKLAADAGHVEAQYDLACCYQNEFYNLKYAFRYFKLASINRHINAIYNLGVCYEYGQGCNKDLQRAYQLYRAAATSKHVDAQNKISDTFYIDGDLILAKN
jgi:TPR repeat protein